MTEKRHRHPKRLEQLRVCVREREACIECKPPAQAIRIEPAFALRKRETERERGPNHASAGQVRWVSVAVMMILTLKKKKGWSSGPVQLDHPGWRRKVAQSHFQAI